jgi:hypothetical protein
MMKLRQKIEVGLLLFLIFLTFASYHESSGGTGWLQFLTLIAIVFFVFTFDMLFTQQSMFIFDPVRAVLNSVV